MTGASSTTPPPAPPGPAPFPPPRWRRTLRRSTSDRMLGGVAGGIAQSYDLDTTLVRLGFVVAALLGGLGVVVYLVAWIVMPDDDGVSSLSAGAGRHHHGHRDGRHHLDVTAIAGLALLALGGLLVLDRLLPDRGPDVFDIAWPLILIGGGVGVLVWRAREASNPNGPNTPRPPSGSDLRNDPEPPASWAPTSEPDAPVEAEAPAAADEPTLAMAATAAHATTSAATSSAWGTPAPWPTGDWPPDDWPPRWQHHGRHHHRHRPHERAFLGPLTISLLFVFAGVVAFLNTTGGVETDPDVVVAIALTIVGAALLIGTWFGRSRGLIVLGLVLAMCSGTLALLDVPLEGGIGERVYRPVSRQDLADRYQLAMGQLTLDLRELDVAEGTVEIEATVAMGALIVQVPDDVDVKVHGEADAGSVVLFGTHTDGIDVADDRSIRADGRTRTTFEIDARVGFGEIQVSRYSDAGDQTLIEEKVA